MICDAPGQRLEPPRWQLTQPGTSEASILFGLATFGTHEQIGHVAAAVQEAGLHCALPKAKDGRIEITVLFDSKTTRDAAFSFYNRVAKGEFGTSATGLMLLPASAAKKQ